MRIISANDSKGGHYSPGIVPTGELHHGALVEIEAMAEMPEEG